MKAWTTRPMLIAAGLVAALLITSYVVATRNGQHTVTAYFDRAVAVYPGTDLRMMGVQIGEVTAVVPEGDRVRVDMRYDGEYSVPQDTTAAIVTPTLIADRYVQVEPYDGGPKLADGGTIPLERTRTPIELDRMFRSLDDLSVALGPQAGGSERGSLASLLDAGADFLDGNGRAGGETIRQLSAVAGTLADHREPLFDDLSALASITEALAANDTTVEGFMTDLAQVSDQLAGEREELAQVLASLADSLDTVRG
ncbi:MAG TPA: MCE family protein, partial [Aeromicrobium sp.]|nr:MCE family protein [Aeromicrobium sp.]